MKAPIISKIEIHEINNALQTSFRNLSLINAQLSSRIDELERKLQIATDSLET